MTYTIHELQNINSVRAGVEYTGTLRGAKMVASYWQMFKGTVLKITDDQGRTVAAKRDGGLWVNYDEYGETK